MWFRRSRVLIVLLFAGVCAVAPVESQAPQPARYHCNGYLVLRLVGTPEQMGRQQGRLLGWQARRVVEDVIGGEADDGARYARLMAGTRRMEQQLPLDIRQELRALADEAGVKYLDLVALQLFGDVWRASHCSSFAVFGPATQGGELIAGRNFDFWDHGVSEYGAVILHYIPETGLPFITITWAGIINGWTAMNLKGVLAANNTAYGGRSSSLDGLSTCFMIRQIVQHAATVREGVTIVEDTPRACGTNMIIAGGNPPEAAVVEYDHEQVAVRWAKPADAPMPEIARNENREGIAISPTNRGGRNSIDLLNPAGNDDFTVRGTSAWDSDSRYSYVSEMPGVVIATNHFRKLYQEDDGSGWRSWCSRYRKLEELIGESYGRIDRSMNFIGAPGVPMGSINLHSALLFPSDLTFRVSMGKAPAYEYPYRAFRLTPAEVVSAEE